MSLLLNFDRYYYLKGDNVSILGNGGFKLPEGLTVERPYYSRANMRFNSEKNLFEFGLEDDWLTLSNIKGNSTWLLAKGDILKGILELDNSARIVLSDGSNQEPVITFKKDTDTGIVNYGEADFGFVVDGYNSEKPIARFYKDNGIQKIELNTHVYSNEIESERYLARNSENIQYSFAEDQYSGMFKKDNGIGFVAKSDTNPIEILSVERNGSEDNDGFVQVNTILKVKHINSFDDNLLIDSNKSVILPTGSTSERPSVTGAIRYNEETKSFEFIFGDKFFNFSADKSINTFVSRDGDNIYGDIIFNDSGIALDNGTAANPSLKFKNKDGLGIYHDPSSQSMDFVVDGTSPSISMYDKNGINEILFDANITSNGNYLVNGTSFDIFSSESVIKSDKTTVSSTEVTLENSILNVVSEAINVKNYLNLNVGSDSSFYGFNILNGEEISTTLEYDILNNKWNFDGKTIAYIQAPQEDNEAANKFYVDSVAADANDSYSSQLGDERTRAEAEEQRIESKIDEFQNNQTEYNNTNDSDLERIDGIISQFKNDQETYNSENDQELERIEQDSKDRDENNRLDVGNLRTTVEQISSRAQFEYFAIQKSILSGESYIVTKNELGEYDLLTTTASIKILDTDANSVTNGRYISRDEGITVAYSTDNIELFNNSDSDIDCYVTILVPVSLSQKNNEDDTDDSSTV